MLMTMWGLTGGGITKIHVKNDGLIRFYMNSCFGFGGIFTNDSIEEIIEKSFIHNKEAETQDRNN